MKHWVLTDGAYEDVTNNGAGDDVINRAGDHGAVIARCYRYAACQMTLGEAAEKADAIFPVAGDEIRMWRDHNVKQWEEAINKDHCQQFSHEVQELQRDKELHETGPRLMPEEGAHSHSGADFDSESGADFGTESEAADMHHDVHPEREAMIEYGHGYGEPEPERSPRHAWLDQRCDELPCSWLVQRKGDCFVKPWGDQQLAPAASQGIAIAMAVRRVKIAFDEAERRHQNGPRMSVRTAARREKRRRSRVGKREWSGVEDARTPFIEKGGDRGG